MTAGRAEYWDNRYRTVGAEQVSWYDPDLRTSLDLLENAGISAATSVIDVGGGAALLVDHLVARGLTDLTVVDVAGAALDESRRRLAGQPAASLVQWVVADLLEWEPDRQWDVWHDRAVFHFLTQEDQVRAYRARVDRAVAPGGHVVLGTFAPDGPPSCSGLPVVRYATDELARVLGDGFELETSCHEDHLTPSGHVQPFSWVLLRRAGAPPSTD